MNSLTLKGSLVDPWYVSLNSIPLKRTRINWGAAGAFVGSDPRKVTGKDLRTLALHWSHVLEASARSLAPFESSFEVLGFGGALGFGSWVWGLWVLGLGFRGLGVGFRAVGSWD